MGEVMKPADGTPNQVGKLSQVDIAVLGLLSQVRKVRNQEILSAATVSLERDVLAEHRATFEGIIGQAALSLSDRIRFLGRHSHLPKFLNGSNIRMKNVPSNESPYKNKYDKNIGVVATPLLFTTDPEFVEDAAIYDGFIFIAPTQGYQVHAPTLIIDHRLVDKYSGTYKVADRYELTVNRDGNSALNVAITSNDFAQYKVRTIDQAIGELLEFSKAHPGFDLHHAPDELRDRYLSIAARTLIDSKVDYPDHLYQFPLGLILQVQNLLSK